MWFLLFDYFLDVFCDFIYYGFVGFFLQWIVFSWGIEPGVWHITVCANSTMGIYESFTKWKVLSGDWTLDVFRGDSVEPYVPRELDGYGIERFSRDKERAVKHL